MSNSPQLLATPWKESSHECACCGKRSKTIWGDLSANEATLAIYYVQWTDGAPEHDVNIDLIIGAWGQGSEAHNRILVSVLFRPSSKGGSFMVIDGESRLSKRLGLCGRAMSRTQVISTPLAQEVFALLDSLWLSDPRISEVKALNDVA